MVIGKSVARWKENRSPKATSIIMKRAYEARSERERERNLIDDQVLPMKNAVPPGLRKTK
jgi:hypothetical protein